MGGRKSSKKETNKLTVLGSIMNFIKEYAVELDALKKLIYAVDDYYNGNGSYIKSITQICTNITQLYESKKFKKLKYIFLEGYNNFVGLKMKLKSKENHHIYRQFFSIQNKIVCEKIIKNIFDLTIIKLLEIYFDKGKDDRKKMNSLESYLIESLTLKASAIGLAKIAPMIAPCTFLASETFKYAFKKSSLIKKMIKGTVSTLQLAPQDLSKKKWVSLYTYRILQQLDITTHLSSRIANDLFVCKPITQGELIELETGKYPELEKPKANESWFDFDWIERGTAKLLDSRELCVVSNITEIKNAAEKLRDDTIWYAACAGPGVPPGQRKIVFELLLTQLSIVFLNELSNAGNNFEKVIDYTTEGETIVNSNNCSIMD